MTEALAIFLALYAIFFVLIFAIGIAALNETNFQNEKRDAARIVLSSFVWPIALVVWLIVKAIQGLMYVWKTADLFDRRDNA